MDRLIADTHAIVWYLTAPRKLGAAARRQFEAADAGRTLCCVPAIALVEITLLQQRGRLAVRVQDVLTALAGVLDTPFSRSTRTRLSSSRAYGA